MSKFNQVLGQPVPDVLWGRSVRSYQPNDAVYNDVRPFEAPLQGYHSPTGLINKVYPLKRSRFKDAGIKVWFPSQVKFKGFNDREDTLGQRFPPIWTPSRHISVAIDNIGIPIR